LKYSSSEKELKMKSRIEELEKLHKEIENSYNHVSFEFNKLQDQVKRHEEK